MRSRRVQSTGALAVLVALLLAAAGAIFASPGGAATPDVHANAVPLVPILIKFKTGASAVDLDAAIQATGGVEIGRAHV